MKFSDLVQQLGIAEASSLEQFPERDPDLTAAAAVKNATPGTIAYIGGAKVANTIHTTAASALILPKNEALQENANERQIAWVSTANPRLGFSIAIALFYQPFRLSPGIHPSAVIDPTVEIGQNAAIGAHVVIHAGTQIGDDVCIHANAVVYPGVSIGDRTTLHANCVIHERSQIGSDCVIHCGAVIGSEGFGFVPIEEGWHKMNQSGITVLEDFVEVGCNSTIDRPSVGETRIRQQTKVDNLVQVAHNCDIGPASALAAQVGLAGGVHTGKRVILGGQVGAADQTQIGDGVQAGSKAGLHGTVKPGSIMMGNPATPYRTFLKASAVYSRLPEMQRTLRQLQRQVDTLQQQLGQASGQAD